mmetsp:Transcript_35359/g.34388  ORF Transcript_35359/g.34388 Transcript_35359/m.34388 type:complete len:96 (+) Transcript_35359:439-726(+)
MLYSQINFSYKPATISRMPPHDPHECVDFVYKCTRDEERDYFSMAGLHVEEEKKEQEEVKGQVDIDRDQEFQDEQMELQRIQEQKLIQEYGVVPG